MPSGKVLVGPLEKLHPMMPPLPGMGQHTVTKLLTVHGPPVGSHASVGMAVRVIVGAIVGAAVIGTQAPLIRLKAEPWLWQIAHCLKPGVQVWQFFTSWAQRAPDSPPPPALLAPAAGLACSLCRPFWPAGVFRGNA